MLNKVIEDNIAKGKNDFHKSKNKGGANPDKVNQHSEFWKAV